MKKEIKKLLLFLILGIAITIIGALFKIMHWYGANILLIIGMSLEVICIISIIKIALKKPNEQKQT